MKKKVFFVVSSLGAGGAERVFWLLSQGFNKNLFDVYLVHLGSVTSAYDTNLEGVTIINLNTIKASKSVNSFIKLVKKEKPYAVFSTGTAVNILVAFVSFFVKIPVKLARESNVYRELEKVYNLPLKLKYIIGISYRRFNGVICQSKEIQESFNQTFKYPKDKLIIIGNPVQIPVVPLRKVNKDVYKILIVARLELQKAHNKILNIINKLPTEYHLTIVGDGSQRKNIEQEIQDLKLTDRVKMVGKVSNVNDYMLSHDVCVLTSTTEGFPNVFLESLAVGTPVIGYNVSGLSALIIQDFNGFIVEQDDEEMFINYLKHSCNKTWSRELIINDVKQRFSLTKISNMYESLIA